MTELLRPQITLIQSIASKVIPTLQTLKVLQEDHFTGRGITRRKKKKKKKKKKREKTGKEEENEE